MQIKGKFILCSTAEFAAWLADTSINRVITLVQNHHTVSPSYENFEGDNHFELLAGMENFHVAERGFDMIAQNITTFPDGTVAVCRPLDRIPAGIKGVNRGGICIDNLGNFDRGCDSMTPAHREAIVAVNAILCRRFALTPSLETVVYHHWYDLASGVRTGGSGNVKSCPGSAFFGGNSEADAAACFIPLLAQPLPPPNRPSTRHAAVTADLLNVRSGGTMGNPVVKQLFHGVSVQVFEERDGWCRIAADRQEWVNGAYLQFS